MTADASNASSDPTAAAAPPGLAAEAAAALAALRLDATETVHPVGATLVADGDVDGGPLVIVDGWAIRQRRMNDGRRQVLGFLLAGDFAALGSIAGQPAGHEVLALTEVRAWRLRRDALHVAASGSREQLALLAVLAARQSAQTDEHVAILGAQIASHRLGTLLLMLHERIARRRGPEPEGGYDFPLTQEHLADATGLSRVHTQRVLGELQRAGVWRVGHRRLELLDRERALRLADWPQPRADAGAP